MKTLDREEDAFVKIVMDWDRCEGNAMCVRAAPEVFKVDDKDMLQILVEGEVASIGRLCTGIDSWLVVMKGDDLHGPRFHFEGSLVSFLVKAGDRITVEGRCDGVFMDTINIRSCRVVRPK